MWYLPKVSQYRGSDPRKRAKAAEYNRVAVQVAEYLNDEAAKLPPDDQRNVLSHTVAAEIGEDAETVRRVIMSYDGGSNGMFIYGIEC